MSSDQNKSDGQGQFVKFRILPEPTDDDEFRALARECMSFIIVSLMIAPSREIAMTGFDAITTDLMSHINQQWPKGAH